MAWRKVVGVAAVLVTLGIVAVAIHLSASPSGQRASSAATGQVDPHLGPARPRTGLRPDIVMVLMDDASYELLRTMPQARKMQALGATYTHAHVVDSLCCPSRTSIFTGRPPHQTGVLTNTAGNPLHPLGGYAGLHRAPQRRPDLQPRPATQWLHDRLRGQVPQRLRHEHRARRARAAAVGAGLGPLRRDPQQWLPGVGVLVGSSGRTRPDAARARGQAPSQLSGGGARPPLRDQRGVRRRDAVPREAPQRHQALLPRGGHLRPARTDAPRLPRQPVVPARVRGPAGTGPPRAATAARSGATSCRCTTSGGTPTRGPTTGRSTCIATGGPPRRRPGTTTR